MVNRSIINSAKLTGLLGLLTGVFLGVGYLIGGTSGMILGLVIAGIFNFGSYWFSDKIVLKIYGAEEIPREANPDLHDTLDKLARDANIPKPKLYRSDMEVPNAFATGRSPKKGVVCVTDGLLNELNNDEVAAVISHELAHIKNRDTLINASVATLAGAISILAEMMFWGALFGGRENEGQMMSSLAFMILTPLIATIIRMSISRKMEFRADSDAVQIQGRKEPLMTALQKISSSNKSTNLKGTKIQESGSNLFIENPFSGDKLTKYFSTHPPLDSRIENIQGTRL